MGKNNINVKFNDFIVYHFKLYKLNKDDQIKCIDMLLILIVLVLVDSAQLFQQAHHCSSCASALCCQRRGESWIQWSENIISCS